MFESYVIVLLLGVFHGFCRTNPVAGATTGLIAVYSFVGMFYDPYMLVVFTNHRSCNIQYRR